MTEREEKLEERRRFFQASPMKALLLDGVIPASVAAEMREGVRPRLQPYYLADRGRYDFDETFTRDDVCYGMAALASETAQVALKVARVRWTRMRRGDYAMYKNDSRLWRGLDHHFEMVLDFSAAPSDEAQVFWATSSDVFFMPQHPHAAVMIDRRQSINRYDRYLTHRAGDAEVFRLNLVLEVD